MSNENDVYAKFVEFLNFRRDAPSDDLDIREWVLDQRHRKVGLGLTSDVLATRFGANLPSLFPKYVAVDSDEIGSCETYFMHGTIHFDPSNSHKGAERLLATTSAVENLCLIETGFLATTHSWVHSSVEKDTKSACLGYVYDDIAHYFMADYPNRLIQRLNSDDELDEPQLANARRLIKQLVERKITKYNSQPMDAPVMAEGYERRVLVCDQAFADASTVYGKVDEDTFEAMLIAALQENPDAEVLVKTHPDSSWKEGKRKGYYSHLKSTGRVRLLRDPVNPFSIFDLVDRVYVGTSQMGLEALFAGKEVVCFGAPFYAGWGLTDDRQKIPHRNRARSLEALFHYFYIWYTIYHVPGRDAPSTIDEVMEYIEANRPFSPDRHIDATSDQPKVSVVIPVYGVEKYIEKCLESVQAQTLRDIEIITVNDCTPDDSQSIIDKLAVDDPRIRPVLLPENGGLGNARNVGIAHAKGKYVWLLDSDDWLENPELLRELFEAAERDELDMARARVAFEAVFDQDDKFLHSRDDRSECHFAQERIGKFSELLNVLQNRHCWNWLYRTEFLKTNKIEFKTSRCEERAFLHQAYISAEKLGLYPIDGPAYRIRTGSISQKIKQVTDYELMLENFSFTFEAYLVAGAVDRHCSLRRHLEFQLSEMTHQMFLGGAYKHFSGLGLRRQNEFLDQVRRLYIEYDFLPADFSEAATNLREKHLASSGYGLIVACVLASRHDILGYAIDLVAVPQDTLCQELLKEPVDNFHALLQEFLSKYAQNDLVVSTPTRLLANAKLPRIIIHIGSTKTGSTSIQSFFENNRPALLRHGVYYPEVGLYHQPGRPHKQAGHADFSPEAVSGSSKLRDHVESAIALCAGKIHTVILSSEAFFLSQHATKLATHFSRYHVEVAVYLRRQDDWLNSQYAEFVAGGAVGRVNVPMNEWLESDLTLKRMDYLSKLRSWENLVGRENIHVGVFDRTSLNDHDIVSDFLSLTGLEFLSDLPRPAKKASNHFPYGAAHVELVRHFNGGNWESHSDYFAFIDELDNGVSEIRSRLGLPKPRLNLLDDAARGQILARVAQENSVIARDYLGRDNGELFDLALPEQDELGDTLSPEELRFMIAAFERHQRGRQGFGSPRQKAPKIAVGRKSLEASPTYESFTKVAPIFLGKKKTKKLREQPLRFFEDVKNPVLRKIYGRIQREMNSTREVKQRSEELIKSTWTYRFISKFGKRLGDRKFAKLETEPNRFFSDMKGAGTGIVRRCLELELRMRA